MRQSQYQRGIKKIRKYREVFPTLFSGACLAGNFDITLLYGKVNKLGICL
jgi:hypothetical protein